MSAVILRASLFEKDADKFWKLKWNVNKPCLRLRDSSGNKLKLYPADLLDIRRHNDQLDLICYPLLNDERVRKIFVCQSDELDRFEQELRKACIPEMPPHRPSQKAIDERHFLVLLNPYSGQKKSEALWQKEIRPILDEMHATFDLKRTERNGHAIQIIQQLEIDNYVGVISLSGDGLIYELLSGLIKRSDYRRALKLPLIHIPTGTSNALAACICYWSREPFSPRNVFCKELTLMCNRPFYRQLSLCHVQTSENGDLPMFMTCSWGLMADIDLGSERFRHFGMIRLHLEAFIRIARLPTVSKYPARISYKPVEDKQLLRNTLIKAKDIVQRLGSKYFYPNSKIQVFDGTEEESENNSEQTIEQAFDGTQLVCDKNGKVPRLNEPVPDDWTTIEGDFVYVCASAISHLGSDLPYVPSAKMEDEVFYITMIDWRELQSRFHVGHLLITIDRGDHLDHSCLHIIPVTACRIEPQTDKPYFAIDGEPCHSGKPFQVFSTNLKATVMGRDPRR
ncbi:DAGKc domain-containing protein [Aphelenchoides bicaudatus]|nr:DAGKc domain-containing protein [Aphelenchoides bicaudatus]